MAQLRDLRPKSSDEYVKFFWYDNKYPITPFHSAEKLKWLE